MEPGWYGRTRVVCVAGALAVGALLWPAQSLRAQGRAPLEFEVSLNGNYKGLELPDGCRFVGDQKLSFSAVGQLLLEPSDDMGMSFTNTQVTGKFATGELFLVCENVRERLAEALSSNKFRVTLVVLFVSGPLPLLDVTFEDGQGLQVTSNADNPVRLDASPIFSLTKSEFERGFAKTYKLSGELPLSGPKGSFAGYSVTGTLTMSYKPDDTPSQQRESVTLAGCTDLTVGSRASLTAVGKPAGGSYRWWTEPTGLISVSSQGATAALTGDAPGNTSVYVEYTAPNGKKAKTSKPATCARVVSINNGNPLIPKLGLYDADGNRVNPNRTVALQTEPASNSHLSFPVDNATVSVNGSSLTLYGTKLGKATMQGQSQCGQKSGPVMTVEVVNCDDDVIAELKRREQALDAEIKALSAQLTAKVKELETATNLDMKDFTDMSVSILKLTTAPLSGAASTAVTAIGAVYSILKNDVFGTEYDVTSGAFGVGENADVTGAQTDIAKEALTKQLEQYGTLAKSLKVVDVAGKLVSFANDAKAFVDAAGKLIDNGGTLGLLAKQMRDIAGMIEEKGRKRDVIVNRLKFCQQAPGTAGGGPPGGGPPAGGKPVGSAPAGAPAGAPGGKTSGGGAPGGGAPGGGAPGRGAPGRGAPGGGASGGGAPGGGAPGGGVPGGGASGGLDFGLGELTKVVDRCQKPVKQFAGPTLTTFLAEVKKLQLSLEDSRASLGLPAPQRKEKLTAGLTVVKHFLYDANGFNGKVGGLVATSAGCNKDLKAVVGRVNTSAGGLVSTLAKPKTPSP